MGRTILGIVVGFLVMYLVVFVGLTAAYLGLGQDGAFQPGVYDVTPTWILIWLLVSLLAAVIGGFVCWWIGRGRGAALVLAGLVLVLGLALAVPVLTAPVPETPPARSGAVGNMAAMQNAREPVWMALLNPVLGAAGVLLGGWRRRRP